jgi:hypothetical protein
MGQLHVSFTLQLVQQRRDQIGRDVAVQGGGQRLDDVEQGQLGSTG